MPYFSQEFISDVMARNSLEQIAAGYVKLKQTGNKYKGLCPFHGEKTPSFTISADRQLYYCFGCGSGGTVVNFVMRMEGLDFVEAVKYLAERVGMEIPNDSGMDNGARKEARDAILEINKEAALYYHACLLKNKGQLHYFLQRGISMLTVKRFALGWAPDDREIIDILVKKGHSEDNILRAGILAQGDNSRYLRFRSRVIFPIIDRRRNVIAFGGRVTDNTIPKYLNSAETAVFDKSANLYGLNFAGKSKRDYFILVEGYMDVIALNQSGLDCAVATLGTALTLNQARLIKRCRDEVVISYDSDEAGQKATARAIEILTGAGLQVRVLSYGGSAKDPDEYIDKFGVAAYEKLIHDASMQIDYKVIKLKEKFDIKSAEGKIAFVKAIAEELSKLESAVEKEVYAKKIALDFDLSKSAIHSEIEGALRARERQERLRARPVATTQKKDVVNPESGLLTLICQDGSVINKVFDKIDLEDFTEGHFREIATRLKNGEDPQAIALDPKLAETISKIIVGEAGYDNIEIGLNELTKKMLSRRYDRLIAETDDIGKIQELMKLKQEVTT